MATSGHALVDRRCRLTIAVPVSTPNDFKNTTSDVIEIDAGAVDDKETVGLRVQFKIEKTLKKEPNTSTITISNLSQSRRASLQQNGVKVLLEAGYRDAGINRYFSGDLRTVDHVRNGADWESLMRLGDGERAWRFARVNESFAPGTPKADVLRRIAKSMGLNMGNLELQLGSVSGNFDQGFMAIGSAGRAMDQAVKSLRKTWSVQDGELQLLGEDDSLDLPIPEITPQTGLIGSPEMGSPRKKGDPALLKFKGLLFPARPGGLVKLRSERYDGYVKIASCSFEGDTSGGPFYTSIAGQITKTK